MRRFAWISILLLMLPASSVLAGRNEADLRVLEVLMAVLVNADRLEAGLPVLEYSEEVAVVARAHSRDMADNDFFAHESPTTGKPADRIAAARVPATGSGENLVIRPDIKSGEVALMNSPKHKDNIMHKMFTHIGVGIVENKDGNLVITQNFIIGVEPMDEKTAPEAILEVINAARSEQELPPVSARRTVSSSARKHSEAMNAGGVRISGAKVKLYSSDQQRYKTIRSAVLTAGKLEDILQVEACLDPKVDEIGIGAVLNTHESQPPGILWVTIILCER